MGGREVIGSRRRCELRGAPSALPMPRLSLPAPRLVAGLFAALLLGALPAAAQPTITWTPRATPGLPASVEVFNGRDAARDITAYLVRADLSDPSVVLDALRSTRAGGVETVEQFARGAGALVAVNGGYYGGGQSFSLVVQNGQTLASNVAAITRSGVVFYPTRSAIGRLATGRLDVGWVVDVSGVQTVYPQPSPNTPTSPQPRPTATFPAGGAPWGAETAMGGGPVLVQNGRPRLTWTEEVFFGGSGVDTTEARPRTVAGYDAAGRLLLLVTTGRGLTLPEAAREMVAAYGAVEAVNLDGGGSSSLWAEGAYLVPSGREVVSALVLRARRPTEARVIDTGDAGRYRETGAWIESANTPFYGATRSRLNVVGTGEDRAVFRIAPEAQNGCVNISAWWTPAPNRARDVRFTLYRGGAAIQSAPVDQSDPATGGRWNLLDFGGPFRTAGDSLVVTDAATGPASPSYVSVDAVRIEPLICSADAGGPGAEVGVVLGPNPARGSVAVRVAPQQAGTVRVELVDLLGRRVAVVEETVGAGEVVVHVPLVGVPAGLYVVRVATPDGRAVRRLTVLPTR